MLMIADGLTDSQMDLYGCLRAHTSNILYFRFSIKWDKLTDCHKYWRYGKCFAESFTRLKQSSSMRTNYHKQIQLSNSVQFNSTQPPNVFCSAMVYNKRTFQDKEELERTDSA